MIFCKENLFAVFSSCFLAKKVKEGGPSSLLLLLAKFYNQLALLSGLRPSLGMDLARSVSQFLSFRDLLNQKVENMKKKKT